MNAYVIDENVPIVANGGKSPQATLECRLNSIEKLKEIKEKGLAIIDDCNVVINLYKKNLSGTGQPGTGDAFLKHLIENYDPKYVIRQPLAKSQGQYDSFPKDIKLKKFHEDDRIFIALLKAYNKKAKILNAVDSDYNHFKNELENNGIEVEELCPNCLKK